MFGPGFSAVLPKWGGLAEVAQVACRACAVGGGVYVLNKGIKSTHEVNEHKLSLELSGSDEIKTTWLVVSADDLSEAGFRQSRDDKPPDMDWTTRSITIVASQLTSLFPPTSEGGVIPAGAVITLDNRPGMTPIHILAHSSESGECSAGQCELNHPPDRPLLLCSDDQSYEYLSTLPEPALIRHLHL